ncbi:MAG: hypothetical protein M1832_000449 [Thelocarpon impressellum]|nr:MAG: hypothetical protein M1832_000449 [Thelocarpon impressellum]
MAVPGTPFDDLDDIYDTPAQDTTPLANASNTSMATHYTETITTISAAEQTQPSGIPGLGMLEPAVPTSRGHGDPHDQTVTIPSAISVKVSPEATDSIDGLEQDQVVMTQSDSTAKAQGIPGLSSTLSLGDISDEKAAESSPIRDVEETTKRPEQLASLPSQTEGTGEAEWEVDSSAPGSSSSDDTSSSDSDDSDKKEDDDDDYELLDPEEQARILMQGEGGSDDEGGNRGGKSGAPVAVKTKNEVLDERVDKPNVVITPAMKLEELGSVESVVQNIVLVKARISGEYQVLESGSVLCLEDRTVVGVVAEPLGRVQQPMYSVRFNSRDEIAEAGLAVGTKMYYVSEHASYVFTQPLKAMKGSDASNLHDEEIGDDELEFSDDEAEAEHKRRVKQERMNRRGARSGPNGGHSKPSNRSGTNQRLDWDRPGTGAGKHDDDDELYTPLARPSNFQELMSSREAPLEVRSFHGYGNRGGRGGRGRGRDRGRAGRGGQIDRRGGPYGGRDLAEEGAREHASENRHASPYMAQYGQPPIAATPPTIGPGFLPQPERYPPAVPAGQFPQMYPQAGQVWPQQLPTTQGYQYAPPQQQSNFFSPPLPASPGGSLPPGTFVNPAFFRNQLSPPAQQGQWSGPQQRHAASPTQHNSTGAARMSPESDAAFRAAQEKLDILKGLTGGQGNR